MASAWLKCHSATAEMSLLRPYWPVRVTTAFRGQQCLLLLRWAQKSVVPWWLIKTIEKGELSIWFPTSLFSRYFCPFLRSNVVEHILTTTRSASTNLNAPVLEHRPLILIKFQTPFHILVKYQISQNASRTECQS